jgi:chromosome segregation ATPase
LKEVEAGRAKLLESSITIKSNLERQVQELRSQLETERADREEVEAQLVDREKQIEELRSQLNQERADREEIENELSELKQKSATAREFPEAAEVYNQFKAENPKTKITYSDMKKILVIIEKSCDDTSQED